MHGKNDVIFMPTDPTDPSSSQPSTSPYQPTPDAPRGGGGVFFVILLLLLLAGSAAYYFLVYKPGAVAAAALPSPTPIAVHTPAPASSAPKVDASGNPTYNSTQRTQYIKQAEDAFNAARQVKSQPYNDAFAAMLASGGFSAAGLASKEAIAARRDLVAKCQTANDGLEDFIKVQDATYKAELQKTPLIPNDVDYVLSDFSYKAQTSDSLKLRDLQRESLKTGDNLLAYLDKTFGGWSVNPAQHLAFKKPADSAAFSAMQKTYSAQVADMSKLQAAIKATADPNSVPAAAASPSPATAAAPGAASPTPGAGTAPGSPSPVPAASATP